MLKIEIDAQDAKIKSKVFPSKVEGKPSRTMFWQDGYMYNGGRYPVKAQIPLEEGVDAYPEGVYGIAPESYQTNKFGKIELNPFNIVLAPFS